MARIGHTGLEHAAMRATAKMKPALCPCCGKHHIRQKYFSMCIHCKQQKKREQREAKQFKKQWQQQSREGIA